MFALDHSIDGFLHPEANTTESKLIWAKRAPRTAAALLVGAALAVSGVLMQALSRNPLAEPGLLGVNSGAAASVVVGVGVFGVSSPFVQLWLALLGSGLAAALVFVMGLVDSKPNLDSTARLVLTGVAVNACLGTITGIITMFNSRAFDSHRFWVVGSLENRTFEQVLSALPFVAFGLLLSFMLIGPLRALALGEDAAAGLGVPVTMVRGATIIAIMALCGAATAIAGPIGFVGLVVPHVVRLLVGSDIARVLPLSLVYGPVLVLASDILGRVLVMPSELEVGIVTAFIGAPVLMVLVLRLSTGARGAKKGRMGEKAQAHDESGPAHVSEHGPHRAHPLLRVVRLAYLVCRPWFLRGFIVSVVSRSVAGSAVAGSVRIPGRYRTPIPRTLLVVAVLVVAAVASLVFGSYQMSPDQVFRLIFQGEGTEIERQLVLNQRLPRMLAAVVVGAALGLSGAIFQSVSRNALGSPDIIGFTVGSATGALSVVLIGSLSSTGVGMGMGAIIGGFATAAVVMLLAGARGGATMGQKMVLIGIAVSAILSSVNDYLITRGDLEKAEAAKTWQHGSLNALSWNQMSVQAVLLLVAIPLVLMLTHRLRVLELGDDLAAGLGLPVKRTVNLLVAAAVLLVAVAISVAGPIGFWRWLPRRLRAACGTLRVWRCGIRRCWVR